MIPGLDSLPCGSSLENIHSGFIFVGITLNVCHVLLLEIPEYLFLGMTVSFVFDESFQKNLMILINIHSSIYFLFIVVQMQSAKSINN